MSSDIPNGHHPAAVQPLEGAVLLGILARAPADQVKTLAESLLDNLGAVEVIENRTGLVMLPYTDSVKGITFHLGEVLISEAHIRLQDHRVESYAACLGRDTRQALAIALLDAALRAGIMVDRIQAFAATQEIELTRADESLLRQVESTRVNMETF